MYNVNNNFNYFKIFQYYMLINKAILVINNFYDFLISKLKDFFKEMSNKNEEIILSEK